MSTGWLRFFAAVVVVQSVHMFEHVVQLIQVYVLHIPDDDALGLLGYVFRIQGTEEWLHLVFNVSFLSALYLLVRPLLRAAPLSPAWALPAFLIGAVGLESWHVVEHAVIISNVIRNCGCPCPGIGDAVTGLTDTVIHFVYNLTAYLSLLPAFAAVLARRRASAMPLAA